MSGALNVALVGVGSWGANLLRNLAAIEEVNLRWLCDPNAGALDRCRLAHPAVSTTTRLEEVLSDNAVEAVAIATPADAHYACALASLRADKHVFVEKPLALRAAHAADLVSEAQRRRRKLMVGHLMCHHPVVEYLKRLMDGGELGAIRYLCAQRVNLGVVRARENAWWSLAPHDISVTCFLFGAVPTSVSATGRSFLQEGVEDVVFATMNFADGRMAQAHVSWLDPHKIREISVIGTEKMVVFDDMEASGKLRIYDKGVRMSPSAAAYAEAIQVRTGDIVIPRIDLSEPLGRECRRFVAAVRRDEPLVSDGHDGLNVVRVLEAGAESLRRGGVPIEVQAQEVSVPADERRPLLAPA